METQEVKKQRWFSGDTRICAGGHRDASGGSILFIIEHPNGTWHNITSGYQYMWDSYPENENENETK